jgi:hypothetical protein
MGHFQTADSTHTPRTMSKILVSYPIIFALFLYCIFASWLWLQRCSGWPYLVRGPRLIDRAYSLVSVLFIHLFVLIVLQAKGASFSISTPSNHHLFVSSQELIKEYTDAPADTLSLHAAAKEVSSTFLT